MELTKKVFGTYQGKMVWQYTLENDHGIRLKVMNYGATLNSIEVPDRMGRLDHVTLGYDRFDDYLKQDAYFGATVGRVAGRIARGHVSLGGKDYQLKINNGENTNHGGPSSFESQLWDSQTLEATKDTVGVVFSLFSPDGTNGFPGNLNVSVSYLLTNDNEWRLFYQATTDKTTLFNPTNHVYFNLSGDLRKAIDDHRLTINGHKYGEIRADGLPTGQLVDVIGTPFDFTKKAAIGRGFESSDPQIQLVNGYDHPFLLDNPRKTAAVLESEVSGLRVSMQTTNNAVVVYTGNAFSSEIFMGDRPMKPHLAITLEAQMMPDAIHHRGFGNIILRPEETYESETVYRFSAF